MSGDKLRISEKISYGFGDFASCLYWQTFMLYLTFFYTDVFGISALAAAALLGLSRSLDAFFDPVVGMIGDRTQTRWGKYRPFLLWFCVPLAFAGALTFTTPDAGTVAKLESVFKGPFQSILTWLGGVFSSVGLKAMGEMANTLGSEVSGKLIWAILTYNALMIIYTAINIPYTAMLGVLTPNPVERTTLSSVKFIGAFMGNIVISFCLLPGMKLLGVESEAKAWQITFTIIGAAVVSFFLITFFNTRERVQPPKAQNTEVKRDLADLFTNWPWIVLLFTTITFILFVAARGSVTVHYFKYFVGTHTITFPAWVPWAGGTQEWGFERLVSWFNGTGGIASLLGVTILPFLVGRFGKRLTFVGLFVVAIASTAAFYVFKPSNLGLIFGINLIGSMTGGPLSAVLWAMYADTADYSEWKRGRRATGLVFSAAIFAQKQGWAIGAAVALILMDQVGFKANVEQTPESLNGLVRLMSLIPAGLGIGSIVLFLFYPLTDKKVAEIGAELKARRIAAGEEPTS